MASFPDFFYESQEISHIDKLHRVIEAVKEAVHGGVSPLRVEKTISLSYKEPQLVLSEKSLQHPIPPEEAALAPATDIANTDLSLGYNHDTAQQTFDIDAAKLAYTKAYFGSNGDQVATAKEENDNRGQPCDDTLTVSFQEDEADGMIALNGSDDPAASWSQKGLANAFLNSYRTRAQLEDGDKWTTLEDKAALHSAQEEEEKEQGHCNSIVVTPESTSGGKSSSKQEGCAQEPAGGKKETAAKPSSNKKVTTLKKTDNSNKEPTARSKTQVAGAKGTAAGAVKNHVAAVAAVATVASKRREDRRTGRPVGYRKQPNGAFAFADGSTVTTSRKSKPSNNNSSSGDKKRKAPAAAAAAAASNDSCKRQRKKPAGNYGGITKVDGSKSKSCDS
ncbi:hypothetical protein N0V93_008642 [Gnomoniopsis smithogilvyi]|uniref:Uncharacterized protein n=1 Tax=Gnomoniopsis smithogilvyi TaxID=1191159 RepID=A0A9W9CUZ2_9PEZI|nr:hypothetical protein N0V93_008642 [Gnomoniopsis smithogilvyi]